MSDTVARIGATPCEAPFSSTLIRKLVATYPDPMTILAPLQPGALAAGVVLAMVALVWHTFGATSPALLLLAQGLISPLASPSLHYWWQPPCGWEVRAKATTAPVTNQPYGS
jgi:hypothetical protein